MIGTRRLEVAPRTVAREARPAGSDEAVVLVHGNPGSSEVLVAEELLRSLDRVLR